MPVIALAGRHGRALCMDHRGVALQILARPNPKREDLVISRVVSAEAGERNHQYSKPGTWPAIFSVLKSAAISACASSRRASQKLDDGERRRYGAESIAGVDTRTAFQAFDGGVSTTVPSVTCMQLCRICRQGSQSQLSDGTRKDRVRARFAV